MSGHSPLGFSGAERYFNCPGSVALIAALPPSDEPDPEWTRAGTAAHAAAADCLREGYDAWMAARQDWEGYTLTAEDLAAIQFYLDTIRARTAGWGDAVRSAHIEQEFRASEIHELAYGTVDHLLIWDNPCNAEITDYKHGEGQFVSVEWNEQMLGYAALVAVNYPAIGRFTLRVVQPRYAGEQKVREWDISREDLMEWVECELKPAMSGAAYGINNPSHKVPLKAGPWCRFCPVQKALACPEHNQIATVVEQAAPTVESLPDARLGELFAKAEVLKMMIKSIEAEVLRRRLNGINVPGTKTVLKKVNRVWKDNAQQTLTAALGPCVMETKLKSPAEMEKLGKSAKQLTKEYAYSPDAGYTVALISDRRHAVTVQKPSEKFSKYIDSSEELS